MREESDKGVGVGSEQSRPEQSRDKAREGVAEHFAGRR